MNMIRHQAAFAGQIAKLFHLQPDDLFLDLTLGDGGHTQEALLAGARVVSFEVDSEAIDRATQFLDGKFTPIIVRPEMKIKIPHDFNWLVVHANFSRLGELSRQYALPQFKGIIADLGTSVYQLTSAERGFSFNQSGPLDMRLDQSLGVSAKDLVNALSENELEELLRLADEYAAKPIARAIAKQRKIAPITTTQQLAQLVSSVKGPRGKIHPATKTFMALRLAVNLERESLFEMLSAIPDLLQKDGLVGIISFHSGEDRLAKQFFKQQQATGIIRVINVKPIKPSENELQLNPKVRSAKLRLGQKK